MWERNVSGFGLCIHLSEIYFGVESGDAVLRDWRSLICHIELSRLNWIVFGSDDERYNRIYR